MALVDRTKADTKRNVAGTGFELPESFLRSRSNAKWNMYASDVLPAFVAEMDFAVADAIQQSVVHIAERQDYGYPMRTGPYSGQALALAFADRMKSNFGWDADAELVLPVADLVQGTYAPIMAFSEAGDGVVLQVPCYPPFRDTIATTHRRLIPLTMRDDGTRYGFDLDEIARLVSGKTRILVLCNPQNPTGRVFTRQELLELGKFAIEHDLVVVSDEIHADLVYSGSRHIPFASLGPEFAARTVTLTSATKSFNIPGLRCALIHFGTARLRDRFTSRIPAKLVGQANAVGMAATVAAWTESQSWLDHVMPHLEAMRDRLTQFMASELPEIGYRPPEGTYLAWLDCSRLNLSGPAFDFFHDQARIAFSAGENFEPSCTQYVRLNFATSAAILDQILDRMATAIRQRKTA